MEEVKGCLLGFHSGLLHQSLTTAPFPAGPQSSSHLDTAAGPYDAYCQTLPFHPTERLLLQRVLPLGRCFHTLQRAAHEVAVGRTEGLYPAAIGNGVKKILENYAEAVKAAATPSALAALPATYAQSFFLLEEITREQQHAEVCLPLLGRFLNHQEVPALFRRFLGESVWLAVLYTTAHYVAHGVVLHARPDYFISLRVKPAASIGSSVAVGRDAGAAAVATVKQSTEEHTLYTDRLPPGMSADLGLLILAAGKERRVLLRDADVQGGSDYLEQLALGSQDEAANAVFHSIFNVQLCHGGVLAMGELAARVEAAKTLWSKALWMKVGDLPSLRGHLAALRSVFLCHRGDVWYAFVERVLPVLAEAHPQLQRRLRKKRSGAASSTSATASAVPPPQEKNEEGNVEDESDGEDAEEVAEGVEERGGSTPSRASLAAASRIAFLQRTVADAFLFALSVSGLRDVAAYETFNMRVSSSGVAQADTAYAVGSSAKTSSGGGVGDGGSGPHNNSPQPQDSRRVRGKRAASIEDMARHLLHMVQSMYVQYLAPQGLPLIVSSKTMQYYQRLFSFHLALRFSLEALAVTRCFFSEALVTNTKPSPDLRRAFALFQLLQFLESTIGYYMQVDVISVCTARLEEQLASSACASVEQAKRFHDQFIWSVSEATFLTDGSEALLLACQSLHTCAVTLYAMCIRYRVPYWAVEGINETPAEVRATLSALEVRVQQDVVAVLTGHLGLGSRPWERALWGRLDFNKFFSQHRARPVVPVQLRSTATTADVFAQPGHTRARSSGRAGRTSASGSGGTTTTPRRRRASSRPAAAS